MSESKYFELIKNTKVPVLVLDQKWHRLFALATKPDDVLEFENLEKDMISRQAELTKEIKDLKNVKNNLRKSVMENMEAAAGGNVSADVEKKRDDDKRLLDETNQRLAEDEDELLELPEKIKQVNLALMAKTMEFCYEKMKSNASEVKEISVWIQNVRVELKRNLIRKQNREINNNEMYNYMYAILGPEILDAFDDGSDFGLNIKNMNPEETVTKDDVKAEEQ